MKKKILLISLMVALFVCILAISVSAEGIKRFATDEFQSGDNITYIDGIDLGAYYSSTDRGAAIDTLYDNSTVARVVVKNSDGTYTTYPTYYFIRVQYDWQGAYQFVFYNRINDMAHITGETYDASSLIRIEFPELREGHTFGKLSGNVEKIANAVNLKYVYISSQFTVINASFDKAKSLETVEFAPNSKITRVVQFSFRQCSSIKELIFPNSLTTLDKEALQGNTSLEKLCLGSSFNKFSNSIAITTIGSANYFELILPSTLDGATYGESYFPSKAIVLFTGTKAQAEAFGFENCISYDEYIAEGFEPAGKTMVYGYSLCDAFYEGEHPMTGQATMQLDSYFKMITFADTCTREGCGRKIVDEEKTIGALFTYLGYSCTEEPIGGTLSMSQFYGINRENIDKYEEATGNEVVYGFVIASVENPFTSEYVDTNKVIVTPAIKTAMNYTGVKVSGITEASANLGVVFCMYVNDGGSIFYLDGGITSETVATKSYTDVLAVANK